MKIKSLTYWAIALVALALFTVTGFAQDAVAAVADAAVVTAPKPSIWLAIIPIVTPLIIAGIKWGIPRVPTKLLPILAPILGMALDLVLHFAAGTNLNPTAGALLGMAGVGLREAVDQVKKGQPVA